ncbi:MAG TPA: type IV toxin-antitoxin system AbiEi family antitoxin domain-containing protein [Gemmataceae bacterium]|nr:type IV toxin-antitoxin system AbiEi family antitoxin domain-containing protein [Gemmataceae bacterium]
MQTRRPKLENSTLDEAKALFRKHGGMMRMANAVHAGIHRTTLYAMRDAGVIEQLSRGLYRLADATPLANPDLVAVSRRVPRGVVCLISALALHGLTTQIPHEVWLAVPRDSEPPRVDYPPIRVFRFANKAFAAGIETKDMDGTSVRVYSREKTLADCFKYRNKIGLDTAVEALKRYKQQGRIDADALLQYAQTCRVANVMRPYLEAVL